MSMRGEWAKKCARRKPGELTVPPRGLFLGVHSGGRILTSGWCLGNRRPHDFSEMFLGVKKNDFPKLHSKNVLILKAKRRGQHGSNAKKKQIRTILEQRLFPTKKIIPHLSPAIASPQRASFVSVLPLMWCGVRMLVL